MPSAKEYLHVSVLAVAHLQNIAPLFVRPLLSCFAAISVSLHGQLFCGISNAVSEHDSSILGSFALSTLLDLVRLRRASWLDEQAGANS